jgi:hypothetical protein
MHATLDRQPGSFFSSLAVKHLSRPFAGILTGFGVKNANATTVGSFSISVAAAVALVLLDQNQYLNRVAVAFLLTLSLLFQFAFGEIAVRYGDKPLFANWLHHYLGRTAEMALYSTLGYFGWRSYGHFYFFIFGVFPGFLFTYFSIIHAERDSIFLEDVKKNEYRSAGDTGDSFRDQPPPACLTRILLYFPMGKAERYLIPALFLLCGRIDILLFAVFQLSIMQSILATLAVSNQMRAETTGTGPGKPVVGGSYHRGSGS